MMNMREGLVLKVETADSRFDRRCDGVQSRHDSGPFGEVSLIKRYNRMDLQIGARLTLDEFAQYGFIISAGESALVRDETGICLERAVRKPIYVENEIDQASVFALNVHAMEIVEKVIPSTVRFQFFQDNLYVAGESLHEFFPLEIPVLKGRSIESDGKINVICPRYAVTVSQRNGQDIKSASHGVEDHPNLNVEIERQGRFLDRYNEIMRLITIRLFDDRLEVERHPGVNTIYEGWEFGYGPINACFGVE